MSADNWAKCPRCAIRRTEQVAQARADASAAYGSIPVEEFDRMRAEAEALAAAPVEPTFREDYEFYGVEDHGVLMIRYSGGCSVCGLRHEVSIDQPLDLSDRPSVSP